MTGKIVDYRQLEFSDCGITCIRIIARYFGKKISMEYLRQIADISKLGISIRDITSICSSVGLRAKALRLSLSLLSEAPLPMIIYWKHSHFMVLYKIDRNGKRFHVVDPSKGKLRLTEEDMVRFFLEGGETGLAVLAEPDDDFSEEALGTGTRGYYRLLELLRSNIKKHKGSFLAITALTAVALASDIAIPFIFRSTVDDGINGKDIGLIWLLIFSQFLIYLGNYASNSVVNVLLTRLGLKISFGMMSSYLHKIVELPMSFFDRKVNSDLIQKLNDQLRIKSFLVSMPDATFFTVINLLVFSSILIYFNIDIFFIFLGFSAIGLYWTLFFKRKRKEIDYSSFSLNSENHNHVYELVNGMGEIKAHGAQQKRVEIWEETQKKINKLTMRSTFITMAQSSGSSLFCRIRDILVTGICATGVVKGRMTIGDMMTISYLVGRLSHPISTLSTSLNNFQDAMISYERVESVMNCSGKNVLIDNNITPGNIRFSNVGFHYPGNFSPFVLRNFNCVIEKGKTTAIVGSSGSGKTTFLKLLLGFYIPQEGKITTDDICISDISDKNWLCNCGVVMQNGYIFSSSVAANIALADDEPDMERVIFAAKMACIDDFIETLPMGYYTKIGNTGIDLSGGQKQRLLIARVIYKNPEIIILDEATSSLDAQNERRIVDNLNAFSAGKTMVIAAHRLCTVRNADRIIFLKNGVVTENGSHKELVDLKGDYYNLVKNQLELGE